jgi:hypothetical protein
MDEVVAHAARSAKSDQGGKSAVDINRQGLRQNPQAYDEYLSAQRGRF